MKLSHKHSLQNRGCKKFPQNDEMTIKTASHPRRQTTVKKSGDATNYKNTYHVLQLIEDLKEITK